jgi:hypothetical protein
LSESTQIRFGGVHANDPSARHREMKNDPSHACDQPSRSRVEEDDERIAQTLPAALRAGANMRRR